MILDTIDFEVVQRETSKLPEIDFDNIPFGKVFADHMLCATYENGKWGNTQILPFGDIQMSPATSMIHYGQSIFEGLKAFRTEDGQIAVFRPEENWKRMNKSAKRLCMPGVPKEIFIEGMKRLIDLDRGWVPTKEESSLYIRPFLFDTDAMLGVKPSQSYMFMIILAPVGPYYSKPLHLKIETKYTRAAMGGVGAVKAAGNYASALYPAQLAAEEGIDQLIWTDGKEHKYLEEAGTMNMMVVINKTLITPPLTSTILPGITRASFLELAREEGYNVEERPITVDEVIGACKNGSLEELFGVGTAATIAQVDKLTHEDQTFQLPQISSREISNTIGTKLVNIKQGRVEDPRQWNTHI